MFFQIGFITDVFILLLALVGLAYYLLTKNFDYWAKRGVPYKKPTALFGNFLEVFRGDISPGPHIAKMYKKFSGPYFGIFAINKPFLVVKDPEIIKTILIKDFHKFDNRFFAQAEDADPMIFNSLLSLRNPQWKTLRSKISPVFTSGKLKMMFPLMLECAEDLQNYIEKNIERTLEMKEVSAKYTTDVITSCAFGINARSFESENSEFRNMGRRIFDFNIKRSIQAVSYFFAPALVKMFKFKFLDGIAVEFLRKVFWETVGARKSTNIKRHDLIDILMEIKASEDENEEFEFDGDRLVAQAVIFFAAGHETTSSAMAFMLYELCINPEIQNRLRHEIKSIVADQGVTYESLHDMKYFDMVLSEILRKYPFAPFINRECSEDYKIEKTGLVVEKGTAVIVPLHGLHYDEQFYPDPQKFDPERFSDENKNKLVPFTYLPFGDGPRICIGQRFGLLSVKTGLVHILLKYEIVKAPETPIPLVFNPRAPLLTSIVGLPLKLKPV